MGSIRAVRPWPRKAPPRARLSTVVACSDKPSELMGAGGSIAYHHTPGTTPGVLFCPGFMSDMSGSKALALEGWCRRQGRQFTRFDYRGCGQSAGDFEDGTISRWTEDAAAVLNAVAGGPQIIVGSSMGGWIMLLLALQYPERVAGLVGVAPSPDLVVRWRASLDATQQEELDTKGFCRRPSRYSDEPYVVTKAFIEDGFGRLVLQQPIPITCPVRILHGMQDPDVPWRGSLDLVEHIAHDDVEVCFVKGGDHRLSRPSDIARLITIVDSLCTSVASSTKSMRLPLPLKFK